ncbi:MAG TPA: hypothetical protein VJT31_20950 [Rugosimonospora sp.]|nr:hypothetical protein [Rugosimonospora sp.]
MAAPAMALLSRESDRVERVVVRNGQPHNAVPAGYYFRHHAVPDIPFESRATAARAAADLFTTAGWHPGGTLALAALCRGCAAPMVFYPDQDKMERWHTDEGFDGVEDVGPHIHHPAPGSAAAADRWDYDDAARGQYGGRGTGPSFTAAAARSRRRRSQREADR